jgi:PTS system nitrogen regulatory IIA component
LPISKYLKIELINPNLSPGKKEDVIKDISKSLGEALNVPYDTIFNTLMEREKLGSTGVGEGVAIPHGKIEGLKEPVLAVGVSGEGIDFDALDGQKVHIFVTLLTPMDSAAEHLSILAKLAKILKMPDFKERLRQASDPQKIYQLFVEGERKLQQGWI